MNGRQGFVPAAYVKKIEPGLSASQQALAEQSSISARQAQIDSQYQSLMALARERKHKLSETCETYLCTRLEVMNLTQPSPKRGRYDLTGQNGKGFILIFVLRNGFLNNAIFSSCTWRSL